jgi:hypothetical protein
MVRDINEAIRIYERAFQPPVVPPTYHAGEDRDAAFAFVSDAYIELFASRDANSSDPVSNGGRHIKRFGEGLANFGWLIEDDIKEAIALCESREYRPMYVAGPVQTAFFFHPRQAYGIMLEIMNGSVRNDPRSEPGWATRWRDEQPLGIERMNCVSYTVRDLDGAVSFLQGLTDAPVIYRGADREAEKESAYLWIRDHVIELMQPTADDSEVGRSLAQEGPKIHSVTFKVKSLKPAVEYLRKLDIGVLGREESGSIMMNPADILGAKYIFSERSIPNDPRNS